MSDSIYKKLVNALFKLSGGQAMPEIGEIATVSVVGDLTYTAPADGYISLSALGQTSDWKRVSLQIDVIDFLIQGTSQYFASGWIPVKKGQSVKVSLKNGSNDVAGSLIFMKLVGGGLTAFLRWLKRGFGEVCYG